MILSDFNENYLELLRHRLLNEKKIIIISCDFNLDLLKYKTNTDTENFLSTMFSNLLLPKILQPTRITPRSATLTYNIFINIQELPSTSGNITTSISDHLTQFLILENVADNAQSKQVKLQRDFKKFDEKKFKDDFEKIDLNESYDLDATNIDSGLSILLKNIDILLDAHAPYKQITEKKVSLSLKPWVTRGIQKSISRRNKLHKKMLKEKQQEMKTNLFRDYRKYCNKITELLRLSKTNYYHKFFEEHKSDHKAVWQRINEIIQSHRCKNNFSPKNIIKDGKYVTTPQNISNNLIHSLPQ